MMTSALILTVLMGGLQAHAQSAPPTGASEPQAQAEPPQPAATPTQEPPPVHWGPQNPAAGSLLPAQKTDNPEQAEKALAPIQKDLDQKKEGSGSPGENAQAPPETTPASPFEVKSRLGFHFALGVPHPLTLGLDYLSVQRNYGFSLIGGATKGKVSDTDINLSNVELQFRYHPWSSAFYCGMGVGHHLVKAQRTETISGVPVTASADVEAGYVSPQIGWIKMWPSGFNLGIQAGVLLQTGSSTDFSTDAPAAVQASAEYLDLEKDVKDKGDQYGKVNLPYLTLLRLGWLF